MKLNFKYHLGGRAYKTALAVFLTEIISLLLNRQSAFYGSIAAVICLMRNREETQKKGIERMIGTIVGGMIGWLFLELVVRIPNYRDFAYAFIAPFGVLGVIYVMNVLGRKTSVMIASVVFLSITVSFNRTLDQIPWYVLDRVLDTGIGVMMATLTTALPLWNDQNGDTTAKP